MNLHLLIHFTFYDANIYSSSKPKPPAPYVDPTRSPHPFPHSPTTPPCPPRPLCPPLRTRAKLPNRQCSTRSRRIWRVHQQRQQRHQRQHKRRLAEATNAHGLFLTSLTRRKRKTQKSARRAKLWPRWRLQPVEPVELELLEPEPKFRTCARGCGLSNVPPVPDPGPGPGPAPPFHPTLCSAWTDHVLLAFILFCFMDSVTCARIARSGRYC